VWLDFALEVRSEFLGYALSDSPSQKTSCVLVSPRTRRKAGHDTGLLLAQNGSVTSLELSRRVMQDLDIGSCSTTPKITLDTAELQRMSPAAGHHGESSNVSSESCSKPVLLVVSPPSLATLSSEDIGQSLQLSFSIWN